LIFTVSVADATWHQRGSFVLLSPEVSGTRRTSSLRTLAPINDWFSYFLCRMCIVLRNTCVAICSLKDNQLFADLDLHFSTKQHRSIV